MLITWMLTGLSITGVILNIKRKQGMSYGLWSVTNIGWCIVDYQAGLSSQAMLFAVYFCLSLWGVWEWHQTKVKQKEIKC